jgi:hypothetical protein
MTWLNHVICELNVTAHPLIHNEFKQNCVHLDLRIICLTQWLTENVTTCKICYWVSTSRENKYKYHSNWKYLNERVKPIEYQDN